MSRRDWSVLGVVVLVVVIALLSIRWMRATDPALSPSGDLATSTASTPTGVLASASPSPVSSPTPSASVAIVTPVPTRRPTAAPRTSGDPRLAYAEFLLRVNDDRASVERLNETLSGAVRAADPTATRNAAADILDFVDEERVWLLGHPPAACYADAHAAALAMLEAYGSAAEAFIDWAGTGGGLAGLEALGTALDAAGLAGDALTAFGDALATTTCQA